MTECLDSGLTVTRVSSLDATIPLRDDWNRLLLQSEAPDIFRTYEWTTTWWRHFGAGDQMSVLVVHDGDRVVGIAPMMVRRESFRGFPVRMLTFMTNRFTSRAGIIVAERQRAVALALSRQWRRHASEWDVLALRVMSRDSLSTSALGEGIRRAGLWAGDPEFSQSLHGIDIAGEYARFIKTRSANFRRSLRQCRNRLGRVESGVFEVLTTGPEARPGVERLFRLATKSPKEQDAEVSMGEMGERFFADIADAFAASHGYENRFLTVDGEDVCGMLSLRLGRAIYPMITFYDPAYRSLSPGRLVLNDLARHYWERGDVDHIDLNSNTENVLPWSNTQRDFVTYYACNRRPYSALIALLRRAKRAGRSAPAAP